MKLVIVESPTKCNTIKKYLGSDFQVMASCGHIRDLSTKGKGGLGVDIDHDFKPDYENSKDKYKIISELKNAKKKASEVYLATDPDREGEAISWHLCEVLGLDPNTTKRLEFHEITKGAILKAIDNPRVIDMSLVQSQETRRIIDRIMGFKLSTLLKNKIGSVSAGRVQSVTLKLITDREKEIQGFVPSEYWNIEAELENGLKIKYENSLDGQNKTISSLEQAQKIVDSLSDEFKVDSLQVRSRRVESKPPFTTSTLQQEAYSKLHFSTKKTQSVAQKLYEGVDIGNNETVGLITYMRTDSIRLSPEFVNNSISFIKDNYGQSYVGRENTKQSKGMVQDAHEAIRPTSLNLNPKSIKQYLSSDEYNLYNLIYKRALASLMSAKQEEVTQVKFLNNGQIFKCEGVVTTFDGYSKLYETADQNSQDKKLPPLEAGQIIKSKEVTKEQKFTLPPSRFNEAKLVKTMEELGIGRPSTYASTISTLKARKYVTSDKGVFTPTEQGIETVKQLAHFFPPFMDTTYTSNMEKKLDDIVDGNDSRINLLRNFYEEFNSFYQVALKEMDKAKPVETGEICPVCFSPLVIKKSKFGEFTACSNYPTCRYIKPKETKPLEVLENEVCPKCGRPLVKRTSKNGDFYACSGFPSCRYIKGQEEQKKLDEITDKICPKCGKPLLKKKGRNNKGDFLACSGFPKCRYIESIK
ncbi:MAG: type I DNA topoisomerase [Bacilli bacterium]|nr:type I DNA topoisomerase [Bacillales bacterium]MDY2574660.1 type I DNA topoisomerase [Bacilli bacterium]